MLLALDVGNLTISVGLFDNQGELKFLAVLDTDKSKTADQIAIDLMNLFQLYHYDLKAVDGSIFCSVVPPMDFGIEKALTRLFGKPPLRVGPGVKTGLNIRMEIHNQLGADLVCGAVAAIQKFEPPIIMIVMGTATVFCYITEKKSFEGGLMFRTDVSGRDSVHGSAVQTHGPAAGCFLCQRSFADRKKYRGLHAVRNRIWYSGHDGRYH